MARQKLGAFARIRRRRDAKLAEKKRASEEAAAASLLAADAIAVPQAEVLKVQLTEAREEAVIAEEQATAAAAKPPELMSPIKVELLRETADHKIAVVMDLEKQSQPAPAEAPSNLLVTLTVFEWALILGSVAVEIFNVNRWYAVGAAVVLTALYWVADKQGWLDFLNL